LKVSEIAVRTFDSLWAFVWRLWRCVMHSSSSYTIRIVYSSLSVSSLTWPRKILLFVVKVIDLMI
jgi:hypothetical protein